MAAEFISNDFLLQSQTAGYLYHEHAEKMPIYDYHCHIPAEQIAAEGLGPQNMVNTGNARQDRIQSRRVEIEVEP